MKFINFTVIKLFLEKNFREIYFFIILRNIYMVIYNLN